MNKNEEIKILELLCSNDSVNCELGKTLVESLNINIKELLEKYGFVNLDLRLRHHRNFTKHTDNSTITGAYYAAVSIDGEDWDNWEEVIDTLKYNKICTLVIYNCKFSRLDILSELNVKDVEITDCNLTEFPVLPKNIENITLSDNLIEEIPNVCYPKVFTLRLDNNRLISIPANINELYPNLGELNITNNLFNRFTPNNFF